jgi:kinesin family protein 2/24
VDHFYNHSFRGIQKFVAEDLFHLLESNEQYREQLVIGVSFFEIYGGRCQDLLNHRNRLEIREDGKGEVQVAGLEELEAADAAGMLGIIELGNRNRTTHATESNDVSSRSHAICSLVVRSRRNGRVVGKLSLIDLAGSERGADTKSHNRQRRMEGAEINKSLLSLKECIRALDCNSGHVPYRASKLTLVLKDAFTNKSSRTVMIVNVSPTASSADHTLNTLRYADRVKERKPSAVGSAQQQPPQQQQPQPLKPDIAKRMAPPRSVSPPQPPAADKSRVDRQDRDEKRGGWGRDREDKKAGRDQARLGFRGRDEEEDDEDDDFDANALTPDKARDDDLHQMHMSLRDSGGLGIGGSRQEQKLDGAEDDDADALESLHRTVEGLFAEEEALLNLHMNVIQENAELLTEEGRLLQQIQGEDVVDYDIGE